MHMHKIAYANATSLLKILSVLACVATIVWAPSALAAGSSLPYGGGGDVRRFDSIISQYNQTGELFRIEGHCQSACTMFLAIKNVCVDRNATLLFHAGQHPYATADMLSKYNTALGSFVTAQHYMDTPVLHAISGRDIIQKFGYPGCSRN
jgi:hypothetical protein